MLKGKSKFGVYLLIFAAVVSPFLYFSSDLKPWKVANPTILVLQQIYQPLEYLWNRTTKSVSDVWESYIYLVDVQQENELLRSRLSQIQARVMDYEHQVGEVRRLKELLGFSKSYQKDIVVGEVISLGKNTLFPAIRINRGTMHDVKPGMPVLTSEGIIGRVLRTGLNYCDVQLTNDTNFSADIVIERTRVRGVVTGTKQNKLRLELKRKMDVKIGDTVITSGIVGGFPKGLPVGRVSRISYETDQLSQIVTIDPWAEFEKLEEVLIIKSDDKYVNMILETAGSEWLDNKNSGG